VPVVMLLASVGLLANSYIQTGEWFERSIDLKGGTLLTIKLTDSVDIPELTSFLSASYGDVYIRELSGISGSTLLINTEADVDSDALLADVSDFGVNVLDTTVHQIGSSLGEAFWAQAQIAIIIALVFMAVIVFFIFRTFVPSMAVISAVVFDLIITLAVMQVFGIQLSLASLAALLMIIGYSVDTDILLTTRLLKGTGEIKERINKTLKTSLTMSFTSIGALAVLTIFNITQILTQISMVLLIGLLIDIVITWLMNASVLRWYMERKGLA
ncbi:MAG: protein translocase subunit SecF, partial [Nanoarchaeota archaeon]|nr:protein translocase subunit SecF [Nanoarchaeota archaeon]